MRISAALWKWLWHTALLLVLFVVVSAVSLRMGRELLGILGGFVTIVVLAACDWVAIVGGGKNTSNRPPESS